MAEPGTNGRYPPAKGLLRLTWEQVQAIDAKVSSLCGFTEDGELEASLVITIKRGHVDCIQMTTSEKLRPKRIFGKT